MVRAGAHTGAFDQALRYIIPRAASLSRLGVIAYLSPQPAGRADVLAGDPENVRLGWPDSLE